MRHHLLSFMKNDVLFYLYSEKRFDDFNCSVARGGLNQVGNWLSLFVVLQAMYGTRRFVDCGVLNKVDVGEHCSRFECRLTEKCWDLF
ncbi:MAG: hypothetical protein ACI9T9_001939 [Oleiphilaceae bacterium]|jgi:hypothetical protein